MNWAIGGNTNIWTDGALLDLSSKSVDPFLTESEGSVAVCCIEGPVNINIKHLVNDKLIQYRLRGSIGRVIDHNQSSGSSSLCSSIS